MSPRRVTVAAAAKALAEQPLVGVKRAAEILDVKTPNFSRYRHRLTKVEVEGSADAFFREEVQKLAEALKAERAARHGGG